jgi:hypothetical protein
MKKINNNLQTVIEIIKSNATLLQKVKRLTFGFKKYKIFSDNFDKQLYNLY